MIDAKTVMYEEGRRQALSLQARSPELTGTQIIDQEHNVPAFDPGKDYTGWSAGYPVADDGQVWLLLQPHNAANYAARPAALRSLWGLAHTTSPAKAKPWVAPYGTSGVYLLEECCTYDGHVWKNKHHSNSYPPNTPGAEDRWEDLGEVRLWQ